MREQALQHPFSLLSTEKRCSYRCESEMINALCSMESLKSTTDMGSSKNQNSYTKLQPASPKDPVTNPKWSPMSLDFDHNSLTPSSLRLPALKSEVDIDNEIQSPNSSMWESLFSDLEGDFMILSPVRNVPSPPVSHFNYNYNHGQSIHGQSLMGWSPTRSSSQKGKGQSPLQKVFNSPKNKKYVQPDSLSMLANFESFLDDLEKDPDNLIAHSTMIKTSGTVGSLCDSLSDEYSLTLPIDSFSRICGLVTEESAPERSQLTQESDIYQVSSLETAPLSQQLQQERQREKQQKQQQQLQHLQPPQQQQHINHSLLVHPLLEQDSGLELVHFLLACAEAVGKEDYMLARKYLHHLNQVVTPLGDSMQRVASCFTEALTAKLAATLTAKPSTYPTPNLKPFLSFPSNSLEILKIYQILYQACPYVKFAHFTANQVIFEAFEAKQHVHIIDLDILQGYQWPAFMQALAARPGGPPFLRITGVGPEPEAVQETGRCLTELAHSLQVPFEFHPVGEQLKNLKPHMFDRRIGEALAVNCVNRLHRVPGNCLGSLLAMIRDQAPNIVTISEQEANHNGPYFLGRFLEALHYYSAIFDSLDATFPPDSAHRAKVEQYIFSPEIRNIIACEGDERVIRHERLEKWRKMMEGKGFNGVALSGNVVNQSKMLLDLYSCDGYRLTEDKGCLVLGWQDRDILAASAWQC